MQREFLLRFNDIIKNSDLRYPSKINLEDISIPNHTEIIGDIFLPPYKIRNLIFSNFFPISKAKILSHYTNLAALEGILNSKSLRLMSLSKRFDEGEFKKFYENNGMTGYYKQEIDGITLAESIVNDAYYISLTTKNNLSHTKRYLWNVFSENSKGVRIDFKFTIDKPSFKPRRIYYTENNQNDFIQKAMELAKRYNRKLVFKDLASAGFFNLINDLSIENETRLLIKKKQAIDLGIEIKKSPKSPYEFIELRLGNNPLGKLEIVNIVGGKRCDNQRLNQLKNSEKTSHTR